MLVTLKDILKDAQKGAYAVGAFNVPNLESVLGVIAAAEAENKPVILQHAEVHEPYVSLECIGPIMLDAARRAKVPVCVHFDHGSTFELCIKAIKMGFTSIMYDASSKPYNENASETKEIVRIAHSVGVSVEAELGQVASSLVGGGEGRGDADAFDADKNEDRYTSPIQAKEFADFTGIDALAISFGTVHGVYLQKPVMNLERITEIRNLTKVPLVMHGGSGIKEEEYKIAISNGICKINYYTYMAMAGAEGVKDMIMHNDDSQVMFFHDMSIAATNAIKLNAQKAISIFSNKARI